MKKILTLIMAAVMILSLASCGQEKASSKKTETKATQSETKSKSSDNSSLTSEKSTASAVETVDTMIPGVLYQLNQDEGEEPVIKGVRLDGGSAGTGPDSYKVDGSINGMPISDSDIRFIFETQEWISIIPDTDKETGLSAFIVEHESDPAVYAYSFVANLSDKVHVVELEKPDENDELYGYWGELFMSSEDWKMGDYDLVFAYNQKPVARVLLRIFDDPELQGKSNAELLAVMDEIKSAAETKAGGGE